MRLSNEGTLASAVWLSRQVCSGPFSTIEALVQHNAPMPTVFYEKWFGWPPMKVQFMAFSVLGDTTALKINAGGPTLTRKPLRARTLSPAM